VALAGLAVAGPALAVRAHAPDPALSGATWDQDERLEYRWRAGSEPPGAIRSAIDAAADDANDTRSSRAATFAYAADGESQIGYGAGATCGVNGIACFTRSAPDGGFTMWLREHGRVFEWGALRWCQMFASPPNGCYDAETIALDEFGHVEGLGHHENHADDRDYLDAVVQTFSRTKPSSGWNMHELGRCDIARLQLRYDITTASDHYSTCLDLETVVSLSASPTSVSFGGTTRLTALLRVVDADAYDRVGGNPVSYRTVRLQRRAPGASTWTTVASMTPTSSPTGSYTASLKLQASAEFRAVFATQSVEGLNGDSSPTVTVTVSGCTSGPCPLGAPAS
jgi:hypothetical protein